RICTSTSCPSATPRSSSSSMVLPCTLPWTVRVMGYSCLVGAEGVPFPSVKLHRAERLEKINFQIVLDGNEGHTEPSEMGLAFLEDLPEGRILHRLPPLESGRHLLLRHSVGEAGVKMGLAAQMLAYPCQNLAGDPGIDGTDVFRE